MSTPESRHIPDIESGRLRLVWMSPAFMRASIEGRLAEAQATLGADLPSAWPEAPAARTMEMRLEQMRRRPEAAEWLLRAMVDRERGRAVGYVNFHGPPENSRAELGYTVFEEYRRQGYAHEAAVAMMRWANETHGVEIFVVSISPDNAPSLALAARLGFVRTGEQWDEEDGEEWVFELRWPGRAGAEEP